MLDDFVKDYLLECQEGLAQFETQLLELEKDPTSKSVLSSIFRVVHSIKGASGFLGFPKMAAITHEGEELLGKLREGEILTTGEIVSGLLALVDAMRSILASIESNRVEGERDDSALIARLKDLQSGKAIEPPPADRAEVESARPKPTPRPRKPKAVETAPVPIPPAPVEAPATAVVDSTIRVDVGLLDRLMNLVGELVLTRNQILRCSLVRDEAMFQASSQRLNLITTELQEGMMKTRMQPIRNLSAKLPRVVRDLALACGKQAAIVIDGEETELDRTISEAIKDPITHIVRNAIDHGIEPPDVRVARGKRPEGTLRLRAYHEGGMVNIEVSDDGNGIDPARIKRKAIERGWLTDEQAAQWSDRDLIALIFRPGFSTAESLTMVSGRGVGMDVVKSRVESIGGSVDATSRLGEGSTIKMKIPLTLTIINALIVSAGGDRFAIPQVNLVELIRLGGDAVRDGLLRVQGTRVVRYRGKLLPLIDLNVVLAIGDDTPGDSESVSIIVLQADQRRFGLVVDRIDDAQEIVVRPLARQLKGISCLAGATIMGDGKIALILDVFGLANGLDGASEGPAGPLLGDPTAATATADDRHALLVLRGTDGGRMAIPLVDVDRLESFARGAVEWAGGRPVVQYRGTLLPLVDVAARLRGDAWAAGPDGTEDEDPLQVVIHGKATGRVGLVFARVLDIVEESLTVRGESRRRGVRLTAAIQGRATEVLDVAAILADAESGTEAHR